MSIRDYVDDYLDAARQKEAIASERNVVQHDKFDRAELDAIKGELGIVGVRTQDLANVAGEDLAQGAEGDTFYSLFKADPQQMEDKEIRPSMLINKYVNDQAREIPDFERARISSSLDLINSALGYAELEPKLETIYDKLEDQVAQAQALEAMIGEHQEGQENLDGLEAELAALMEGEGEADGQDLQDQAAAAREALEKLEQGMSDLADDMDEQLDLNSIEVKEHLAEGLKDAEEQMDRMDAVESFGLEPGSIHRVPPAKRLELAKRLDNEKFRKIAELIGPMIRLAFTEQQRKTKFARNEIYDIILGNDLAHLLPSELFWLEDDLLFLDFIRKYFEQGLQQYELKGTESIDKGNIIWCEDGSGSMGGSREIFAKAASGALMQIARRQGRGFTGIHFGSPAEYMQFDFDFKGDEVKTKYLAGSYDKGFKNGEYNVFDGILHWMEIFFNSGTDFMTPLTVAREMLEEQFATNGEVDGDIVFCTDGMCAVDDEWLEEFQERKRILGFRVFGLIIGGKADSEPLATIADEMYTIHDLVSGEDLRGVFGGV